jgi:hypothetical protein
MGREGTLKCTCWCQSRVKGGLDVSSAPHRVAPPPAPDPSRGGPGGREHVSPHPARTRAGAQALTTLETVVVAMGGHLQREQGSPTIVEAAWDATTRVRGTLIPTIPALQNCSCDRTSFEGRVGFSYFPLAFGTGNRPGK